MKKSTLFLVCLFFVCFFAGITLELSAQRGTVIKAVPLTTVTPSEIMLTLQASLDETAYSLVDLFTYKKHSVTAVKVIYQTIDATGSPTVASGVVFIPAVEEAKQVPLFMYLHGTLTRDIDAPSYLKGIETVIGWIMAMDGYIAVLPDYLGLGDGPGVHPYHHSASEASASVDMLKAAVAVCADPLVCTDPLVCAKPDGNLYMSGYSQGGHAALATQNVLQNNPLPGITLRKTVAGSGAYSLSQVQKSYLFDHPVYPSPSFLPYMLMSFQEAYGNLYGNLGQVFVSPYNLHIPDLFNGLYTTDQINIQLPPEWKTMFVPKYLWNIQYNYFHPVNSALRKNDVIGWKPKSDLHLYYCTCDELVANENSLLAYLSFLLRGSSKVSCLPVGPFKHAECAPFVLLLSKIQFDCASGANPCGINLLSLLKSATKEDFPEFRNAVSGLTPSPRIEELMKNEQLAAWVRENELQASEGPAELTVYPNPVYDVVNIERPAGLQGLVRVALYDMQGRLVMEEDFTGSVMQINVRPLPAGAYQIVLNGDRIMTKTLIVMD